MSSRVKLNDIPAPQNTDNINGKDVSLGCTVGQLVKHFINLVPDVIEEFTDPDNIYIDIYDSSRFATKSFIERAQEPVYLYEGETGGGKKFKFNGTIGNLPKLYIGSLGDDTNVFNDNDEYMINEIVKFGDIYAKVPEKKVKITLMDTNVNKLTITHTNEEEPVDMLSARFYPPYIFRYNIDEVYTNSSILNTSINISFEIVSSTLTSYIISADMPSTNSLNENKNVPTLSYVNQGEIVKVSGENEMLDYKLQKEDDKKYIKFDLSNIVDDVNLFIEGSEAENVKFKVHTNKCIYIYDKYSPAQKLGNETLVTDLETLLNYCGECLFDKYTNYDAEDTVHYECVEWETTSVHRRIIDLTAQYNTMFFTRFDQFKIVVKLQERDNIIDSMNADITINPTTLTYNIDVPEENLKDYTYDVYVYALPNLNDMRFYATSTSDDPKPIPTPKYINVYRYVDSYMKTTNIGTDKVSYNKYIPFTIELGFAIEDVINLCKRIQLYINGTAYDIVNRDDNQIVHNDSVSYKFSTREYNSNNTLSVLFKQFDAPVRTYGVSFSTCTDLGTGTSQLPFTALRAYEVNKNIDYTVSASINKYTTTQYEETNDNVVVYMKWQSDFVVTSPKIYRTGNIFLNAKDYFSGLIRYKKNNESSAEYIDILMSTDDKKYTKTLEVIDNQTAINFTAKYIGNDNKKTIKFFVNRELDKLNLLTSKDGGTTWLINIDEQLTKEPDMVTIDNFGYSASHYVYTLELNESSEDFIKKWYKVQYKIKNKPIPAEAPGHIPFRQALSSMVYYPDRDYVQTGGTTLSELQPVDNYYEQTFFQLDSSHSGLMILDLAITFANARYGASFFMPEGEYSIHLNDRTKTKFVQIYPQLSLYGYGDVYAKLTPEQSQYIYVVLSRENTEKTETVYAYKDYLINSDNYYTLLGTFTFDEGSNYSNPIMYNMKHNVAYFTHEKREKPYTYDKHICSNDVYIIHYNLDSGMPGMFDDDPDYSIFEVNMHVQTDTRILTVEFIGNPGYEKVFNTIYVYNSPNMSPASRVATIKDVASGSKHNFNLEWANGDLYLAADNVISLT